MDQQALQEIITLFLKINPQPSDQQFHALAEACGCDKETLESISYGMLSEAEDLLEDPPVDASSTHQSNDSPVSRHDADIYAGSPSTAVDYGDDDEEAGATHSGDEPVIPVATTASARKRLRIMSSHGFEVDADSSAQITLDDPAADPDNMSLQDVALNDGDPTNDDLGMQQETLDDGFSIADKGAGLVNNVSDALTDDGVPDISLP